MEHAQKPYLHARLGLPDFVEEDRPAVRNLEEPQLVRVSPRKGAPLMPEELALEQCVGQRPAVLGHKLLLVTRPCVVNRTRNEILAGSRLPGQQHRRIRLSNLLGHIEDFLHDRGITDDPLEGIPRFDLPAQIDVLRAQPIISLGQSVRELRVLIRELKHLQPALHRDPQIVRLPRLRQIAPDAPFIDRRNQCGHIGVARQHHPNRARIALHRTLKKLDAAHPGHRLIRDDQGDVFAVEDPQAFFTARRSKDAVLEPKRQLETLEDRVLVVDDQNPVGRGLVSARSCTLDLGHGPTLTQDEYSLARLGSK